MRTSFLKLPIGVDKYVEALHWQSELPGFYTQYFAGKSGSVAVLATASARKPVLASVTEDLRSVVGSLKVTAAQ